MASIKSTYAPIDIHKGQGWPEVVPPLTEKMATLALKRLYRYGVGQRFEGNVHITTGNRRAVRFAWELMRGGIVSRRSAWVNPSQGWQDFIHGMSHWLDYIVNGEMPHSKHHARFEAKLIREVVKRGWLNPESEVVVEPKVVSINNTQAKRQLALDRIEVRIANWQRKLTRAENALRKLGKQQRYYTKALATDGA